MKKTRQIEMNVAYILSAINMLESISSDDPFNIQKQETIIRDSITSSKTLLDQLEKEYLPEI